MIACDASSLETRHLPSKAMCSWFQVLPSARVVRLATPLIWYLRTRRGVSWACAQVCQQRCGCANGWETVGCHGVAQEVSQRCLGSVLAPVVPPRHHARVTRRLVAQPPIGLAKVVVHGVRPVVVPRPHHDVRLLKADRSRFRDRNRAAPCAMMHGSEMRRAMLNE